MSCRITQESLCRMVEKAFLLLCAFAALSTYQCASISIGNYIFNVLLTKAKIILDVYIL